MLARVLVPVALAPAALAVRVAVAAFAAEDRVSVANAAPARRIVVDRCWRLLRQLMRLVGRTAIELSTLYVEVSLRPGHSGQLSAQREFELLATQLT